ncbi:dTDP-4-amino-4,6-dideoxygalactose transaminase [Tardiphaga sp. vice352]|uniref:dTDP-4-amino-4,6-dideoxygalactose transaminase n=1 Tax=Tardiphaga sp. vice352 TaxID=2592816 RepID=UPI001165BC79|nr:dTDP-4-amino-4,6-dideoxygalactose transaminase [Tardiphaga sp. vice352]QDM33299.1 dTDP-4-amino-4,6-dideoxygalactose transaminase [Tardiphaga sp. vice352]
MTILPFNIPPVAGREIQYLTDVIASLRFSGDGAFTAKCQDWLTAALSVDSALLTTSCTSALEMAAILANLGPGDEVIMPSFTFVSTANAVVLRGATPVFVDIRQDTQNIDETLIEAAITPRTKAIFVVHYAGVCVEMDAINRIARQHGLIVVEDAAQALLSTYHGRPAGQLGDLGCFSFHETKNITSGEGGALTIANPAFSKRAYVIWEKGTNRRAFRSGFVDKYTWIDCGSSFLPSEFTAAILLAQLEQAKRFNTERCAAWHRYHEGFGDLEQQGKVRRPIVPAHCLHNGHMYYLLLPSQAERDQTIAKLAADGLFAVFHYIPLHSSPAGQRFGRTHGALSVTDDTSARLVRLPLYAGMDVTATDRVLDRVHAVLA